MSRDGPSITRTGRTAQASVWPLVVAGILLVAIGAFALSLFWRATPAGTLVEVRGNVPNPGVHRIEPATLNRALAAAGLEREASNAELHEGDLVRVSADGIAISPAGNPLLYALPVNLNEADAEALGAVPGLGRERVLAILADRTLKGPFYAVADLGRVDGIGPSTVESIATLLTVGDVGPRPAPEPIDLNTAPAWTLQTLPGVGPVMAARIVVDREENGAYANLQELQRVKGVGPKLVERLRGEVQVADSTPTPP